MKTIILSIVIFFFCCEVCHAQKRIEGYVLDKEGKPIPYTSVYDRKGNKGTFTDINGLFLLEVPKIPTTLEFSNVGYEKIEKNITDEGSLTITLNEKVIVLEEVSVYSDRKRSTYIGSPKRDKGIRWYFAKLPFEQLGLVINNEENQLYRDPIWLSFSVRIAPWSILGIPVSVKPTGEKQLRLRMYKINQQAGIEEDAFIAEDILHENIFLSPSKKGWYTVDLRDQHLILPQEGFMVAVEWLENQPTYEYEMTYSDGSKKTKEEDYGIGIKGHNLSEKEKIMYTALIFPSPSIGWKRERIYSTKETIPCFRLEFIEMDEVAR